jgi:hypothetical protein
MRPLSSGYVKTGTPNPAEAPAINPRYPSDPTDRRAIIGSLRFIHRLFPTPALARYWAPSAAPPARSDPLLSPKPLEREH